MGSELSRLLRLRMAETSVARLTASPRDDLAATPFASNALAVRPFTPAASLAIVSSPHPCFLSVTSP
jgi:hypothetical protein